MKRRIFLSSIAQAAASTLFAKNMVHFFDTATDNPWQVHQFKDSGLAHFSYAILVDKKIILVDPARDARQYFDFARDNGAVITGIIETHPHADFVSSHLEIATETGATIYTSGLMKPDYKHSAFDEGNILTLNKSVTLRSLYTPGHAPDSISVVLVQDGKDKLVFTGDSLLIGDVGRPDLREYGGDIASQRKRLAAQMYDTIWQKFDHLADDVIVYPAHGAGSLCGKNMRDAASSTIGEEKQHNYAFQKTDKASFVELLLKDLPAVPLYFPYDVALNLKGAPGLEKSIAAIPLLADNYQPADNDTIIDVRSASLFRSSYLSGAYNLQNGTKFETWLGSVIAPDKPFYLVAESAEVLNATLRKAAKIGYESAIKGAFVYTATNGNHSTALDAAQFGKDPEAYTIIDVRTEKEAAEKKLFPTAINIPVNELSTRIHDIPTNKPIVVHCASGYRSALGSSILKKYLPAQPIYDFGPPK
jgi:glyoxylase-like metal-dependent hydrolase (beta-lactamase superfamily II)/rhodanese-related sulfurtransferase